MPSIYVLFFISQLLFFDRNMPLRHVSTQVAAFNIFDRFFDQKMPFECGEKFEIIEKY